MASATEISRLDYIEKAKLEKLLSLVDLDSDVLSILINEPEDGQTLVYEATSGKWKNKEVSGGGGDSVVVTVDPLTNELSMTFSEIDNAIFEENKMVSIFYGNAMYYYQYVIPGEDMEDSTLVFATLNVFSNLMGNDETVELSELIVNSNGFENKSIQLYPQSGGGGGLI